MSGKIAPLLPARRLSSRGFLTGKSCRRCWVLTTSLVSLAVCTWLLYRLLFSTATSEQDEDDQADQLLLESNPSAAFCTRTNAPLICAHGGDATGAKAYPNTRRAFLEAKRKGCDCVELDIACTMDGHLVVMHVRELHQLRGVQGEQVGELTLQQIQRLKWPDGEPVPVAADIIRLLQQAKTLILDIKLLEVEREYSQEDAMAQAVVDLIKETACSTCLVWAKSDNFMRLVKELSPEQRCGYVVMPGQPYNGSIKDQAQYKQCSLLRMPEMEVVGVHYAMASVELVNQAHQAGQLVYAWTANTAIMMHSVLAAAPDAVVTSFPTMLQHAMYLRLAKCQALEAHKPEKHIKLLTDEL